MTQNQLHELLETEQARALVERSEERGWIEPLDFEAFTLEHELNDEEVEELTRELERIGLEVGRPAAAAGTEAEKVEPEKSRLPSSPRRRSPAPPTASSSSSPTSAATSC